MTDYWISNERHYCKECGCWMDGKASSIRRHEEGFRHKGNVDRLLKKLKRDKIVAQKEANRQNAEIAAIERAAKKQYIKDCANGLAAMQGHSGMVHPHHGGAKQRKDKDRTFLPINENDAYYYLDKDGVTHGPYTALKMCTWYHFGFFVGALRVRLRTETEFVHLRNMENPFNYPEFKQQFESNEQFKRNAIQSVDIADAETLPPGIEIPQKLKDQFYRLYPAQKQHKTRPATDTHRANDSRFQPHQYYSDGVDFKAKGRDGMSQKEQRRIFVRGQMRKYKQQCNCGDSDCHIKHAHHGHHQESHDTDSDKKKKTKTGEEAEEAVKDTVQEEGDTDEFGFGKWEQVTKEEFDQKHSNEQLLKQQRQQESGKKRWWRDQINANLPVAKRKKLMGIDQMASDEERDYDDEYGVQQILQQSQLNKAAEERHDDALHGEYKESKEKIAISIGTKISVQSGGMQEELLDEEDVMVRDAKLKLKQMKEDKLKKERQQKQTMLDRLDGHDDGEDVNATANVNEIDDELRLRQQIEGKRWWNDTEYLKDAKLTYFHKFGDDNDPRYQSIKYKRTNSENEPNASAQDEQKQAETSNDDEESHAKQQGITGLDEDDHV